MANQMRALAIVVAWLAILGMPDSSSANHTYQTFPNATTQNGPISWGVMDALPSGPNNDTSSRNVVLTFDILMGGTTPTDSSPLRIRAQGQTLFDGDWDRGYAIDQKFYFPLYSEQGCCTAIHVIVDQPGFQSGIDEYASFTNISLDWSQQLVPEPSAGLLVLLGLIGLEIRARRWPVDRAAPLLR
jgi:hypothetical protein